MKKQIKVYEIYPTPTGYTNMSVKYRGEIVAVSAVSLKQAYFLADMNMWADNKSNNPVGILWTYDKFRNYDDGLNQVREGLWLNDNDFPFQPRHMAKAGIIREYLESISKLSPRSSEDRAVAS